LAETARPQRSRRAHAREEHQDRIDRWEDALADLTAELERLRAMPNPPADEVRDVVDRRRSLEACDPRPRKPNRG
jgi:hypothetical protein